MRETRQWNLKFEMNVTGSYSNDAMLRQISEGVRIDQVQEDSLMNSKNEWNYFNAGWQTYISILSPSKVYKWCKNSSYLVKFDKLLSELLIVSHFRLFRNSSSKFHRPRCTFGMAFHKEYSRRRRGKDLSNKPLPRPLSGKTVKS